MRNVLSAPRLTLVTLLLIWAIPSFGEETVRYQFSTLAGFSGRHGALNGPGASATFFHPTGVAADLAGNVFVADSANHVIRKLSPTGMVSTYAGLENVAGSQDGSGVVALFNYPTGIAIDYENNLYVADTGNSTIRRISADGIVSTHAGMALRPGSLDGPRQGSSFSFPTGLAVDRKGNVYVADGTNHTIRKIDASGWVETVAGAAGVPGFADGFQTTARFSSPYSLAVDAGGVLYVTDSRNETIRKIDSTGRVTTAYGTPPPSASAGAPAAPAGLFQRPAGIAVDATGALFVAEANHHTIRRISPIGEITLIGGADGMAGRVDGFGSAARFHYPFGIAAAADGSLIIADTMNQAIRIARPAAIAPVPLGRQRGARRTGS